MKWSDIAPEGTAAWCDQWRGKYRDMDYSAHQEANDAILGAHPNQAGYDAEAFDFCIGGLDHSGGNLRVLEFGGWRGGLANHALSNFPIKSWDNYEISRLALEDPECISSRYTCFVPHKFVWESLALDAEIFVSSHAIEHISKEHLAKLFNWIPKSVKHLWLQAPLPESCEENKWEGYGGTHILEIGWAQVIEMLAPKYEVIWRGGIRNECLFFQSKQS